MFLNDYTIIRTCVNARERREDMVSKNLLRAKIIANGFTSEEVAHKLGIDPSSLNQKMNPNNNRTFTVDEVGKLIKILNIPVEELQDIFFAD